MDAYQFHHQLNEKLNCIETLCRKVQLNATTPQFTIEVESLVYTFEEIEELVIGYFRKLAVCTWDGERYYFAFETQFVKEHTMRIIVSHKVVKSEDTDATSEEMTTGELAKKWHGVIPVFTLTEKRAYLLKKLCV